ncbi:LysE family transporter [Variovorax sp. PCZ-1]|uniref:LysE family translocator n=1 Tax=Variovorax sp. PCZ-1 TaxID=2835533 RepID=UPI001BCEE88D|nr:LysE family transporter [Variovorax sp. PCZ-1]MBS7807554.1 LysE family transporter [Variovorax sp. PCZ-1]
MEFPSYLTSVGLILLALLAGVLSPGPSFVMAARTAVAKSRDDGLMVSLGLGLGATLIAALCLAGLSAVLHAVPALYMLLKVLGGLYLAWLAWQIWRSAPQPLDIGSLSSEASSARKAQYWASFRLGLITQISNPKAAVVYGSVFAALLPAQFPLTGSVMVAAGVFVMEFAWYAIVVLVLSSPAPRAAYMRGKKAIDRIAAGVMGLLAARLISTAHHAH